MTTNKSIRIKNSNNEKATIQPIGEFYCNVTWDNDTVNNFRVAKHNVDDLLARGAWTEIDDVLAEASTYHKGERILPDNAYNTNLYNNTSKIAHELFVAELQAREENVKFDNNYDDHILQRIKEFTEYSGHTVLITGDGYEVYRKDEDVPYETDCEHCLLDIMNALEVLDEHSEN